MHRFMRIGLVPALLLLVVAFSATAIGCGSSNDSNPASTDSNPASTDSNAGSENLTIRYSQPGASLSFATALYALAAGLCEKEGLTVETVPFLTDPPAIINLLNTDGADVVSNATTPIYQASERGVISVAMSGKGTTHALALTDDAVKRLAAQGVTPESPLEDRIAALKGLSLASVKPGSFVYQELVYILRQAGLSVKDVDLNFIADFPTAIAAAKQGRVDGYLAPVPASLVGVAEDWATIWLKANEFPVYRDANQTDIATTRKFAEENPAAIQAFLRCLYQAQLAFRTNPDEVKRVLKNSEFFKETPPRLFDLAMEETIPLYAKQDFTPTEQAFKNSYSLYQEGSQTVDVTFAELYPEVWREFDAKLFQSEPWVTGGEGAPVTPADEAATEKEE